MNFAWNAFGLRLSTDLRASSTLSRVSSLFAQSLQLHPSHMSPTEKQSQ